MLKNLEEIVENLSILFFEVQYCFQNLLKIGYY